MDTAQDSLVNHVSTSDGAEFEEAAAEEPQRGISGSRRPPLLCVQCTHELRDPHLLCCLHCVCAECLERVKQQDGHLKCPQCGDTSTAIHPAETESRSVLRSHCLSSPVSHAPIPITVNSQQEDLEQAKTKCTNKFCSLPDFPEAVVHCVDCDVYFCSHCLEGHRMMGKLTEKHLLCPVKSDVVGAGTRREFCPSHRGQLLQHYCERCNCVFCRECTTAEGMPGGHALKPLDGAVFGHVEDVVKLFEDTVSECCVKYEKALSECVAHETSIERYSEAALSEIHAYFNIFRGVLRRREEAMEQRVEKARQRKKNHVIEKVKQYSKEKESLEGIRGAMELLVDGGLHQVLPLVPLVASRREALVELGNKERFDSTISPCVGFVSDRERSGAVVAAISKLGHIQEGASALHCTVDPKLDTISQLSDQPVVLTLTAVDSSNIPCTSGGERVKAFLRPRPPVPGPSIKAAVEDRENGQYTITLVETNGKGEFELCILVNGRHIPGSPSLVVAQHKGDTSPDLPPPTSDVGIDMSGRYGISQGFLQFPSIPGQLWGIAVSPNGTIFVADNSSGQIHVFDEQRKHKVALNFGKRGSMWYPRGLATDKEGHLFVANDNGIDVFTEHGKFLHRFCQGAKLSGASDVAISNADHRVYVADTYNHCIAVFSQDGHHLHTFGSKGSGQGQFDRPSGLALSSSGLRLFVSDWGSSRIQVFTADGVYISEFGHNLLNYPRHLVTTSNGRIFVADNGNNRIAVFSELGEVVGVFGHQGLEAGCLWNPTALAIDAHGQLLVTECNNARVQIFQI